MFPWQSVSSSSKWCCTFCSRSFLNLHRCNNLKSEAHAYLSSSIVYPYIWLTKRWLTISPQDVCKTNYAGTIRPIHVDPFIRLACFPVPLAMATASTHCAWLAGRTIKWKSMQSHVPWSSLSHHLSLSLPIYLSLLAFFERQHSFS